MTKNGKKILFLLSVPNVEQSCFRVTIILRYFQTKMNKLPSILAHQEPTRTQGTLADDRDNLLLSGTRKWAFRPANPVGQYI
jgi:hypothetical protein